MTLQNGSNYSVNNSTRVVKSLANNNDTQYAYDDSAVSTSGSEVVYKKNGSTIYTSTSTTSSDLYAKSKSYYINTSAKMTSGSSSYTWEIVGDESNWVASTSGANRCGLDTSTTGTQTDTYQFKFQNNAGIKLYIYENGDLKYTEDYASPALGDTFTIQWTPPSGGGTRLPPPPLIARF